jgi:ceramide glucosyltransferase
VTHWHALWNWHTAWRYAVLLVAVAPLAYYLLSTVAAWRFFSRERARKLQDFTPPLSILKAVRGVDFATYENYASFCRQDYPHYEIIFALNEADDPAGPIIRRLMEEFPKREIRLLVGAEELGTNRKVNKLARMAAEARYEILALSDGDVRVGPNYLREVAAPFAERKNAANRENGVNEQIGAVTSFYAGVAENNLGARLEAIGAASDFFAGVLMADWMEGMHFALGASIVTTKTWLGKIGGFATIADMLADDYELGRRIAEVGGTVLLSREIVWTMYPAQTFRGFWEHQLRWARTVRLCRPLSYAGLIFTHGLPWAVLAFVVAPMRWLGVSYLAAYLILRLTMAWIVGVWGVCDETARRKPWLIPLRDAINFVVWLASLVGNRIVWGGIAYAIDKGRMSPIAAEHGVAGKPAARRA